MLKRFTLKHARKLVPYRSTAVLNDWMSKGILAAERPDGSRRSHFTPWQLLDLLVVDQMSQLGLFQKQYLGKNFLSLERGEGNIHESFDFTPDEVNDDSINPDERSREHAINFYKRYSGQVFIGIDIRRLSQKVTDRNKAGMLYYHVEYFQALDPLLSEQVLSWKDRYALGETLCLIHVRRLKERVESTLGIKIT